MVTKAEPIDVKALRGTKRTCQNPECGSRFYDLNRQPITCPICGTVYELAHAVPEAPTEKVQRPPVKQPIEERPRPEEVPEIEGEELVAAGGDEAAAEADEDETLIEDLEEGSDVSGIIDTTNEDSDEKDASG